MEDGSRRIRFSQRLVIPFLSVLLFLAPFLSAQEAAGIIQAEWKDSIIENQRFTLKYITPFPGKQSVDISDPEWPEGIRKVSGPYTAQRTVQMEDGSFSTVLQIIYTLRSDAPGIYTIPALSVKARRAAPGIPVRALSPELYVPILRSDERNLRFPLILEWDSLPDSVYAGQAVPLVLMMNNMEEIDLPESVSLSSPSGAILENIDGLGEIRFSGLNEITLFHVPMETWMLTPSREGSLSIPAAEVRIANVRRSTSRRTVRVLPLPEEASSSGAVGTFELSAELSSDETVPGGGLQLILRLEGDGNLNYLNMPEPVFPEGTSVTSRDEADFHAGERGFSGYREMVYTLRNDTLGRHEVVIPPYSWIEPEGGAVRTFSEKRLSFSVIGDLPGAAGTEGRDLTLIGPEELLKTGGSALYRRGLMYLFLLPGALFLLFVLTARRFRPALLSVFFLSLIFTGASSDSLTDREWLIQAEEAFGQENYTGALDLYREQEESFGNNAAYLHNRGVIRFLMEDYSEGIALLRKANRLKPASAGIRNTLIQMEQTLSLEHQIDVRILIHPDVLFLLLVIGLNGAMIALAYCFLRKNSLPVLVFLLCLFFSLVCGGELIRTSWNLGRPVAVLKEEGLSGKIPEIMARDWLNLPEGTTVSYKKEQGEYVLIRTVYGLEGWILRDQLIYLGDSNEF